MKETLQPASHGHEFLDDFKFTIFVDIFQLTSIGYKK